MNTASLTAHVCCRVLKSDHNQDEETCKTHIPWTATCIYQWLFQGHFFIQMHTYRPNKEKRIMACVLSSLTLRSSTRNISPNSFYVSSKTLNNSNTFWKCRKWVTVLIHQTPEISGWTVWVQKTYLLSLSCSCFWELFLLLEGFWTGQKQNHASFHLCANVQRS